MSPGVSPVGVRTLRVGTRRSALALAQAGAVADLLRTAGHDAQLVEVVTEGDRRDGPLTEMGGTGVFVTELRRRLAADELDLVVHSAKDLPTAALPGIELAAVPGRADPRDALVSGGLTLADLPPGARVATGSPRRAAALHAARGDLDVVAIRGNIDTRLRRLAAGEIDALVVAAAGLERLGRLDEAAEVLDPAVMMPAPAQGALAVECRADNVGLAALLRSVLDDAATHAAVTAERALLARLEAGCAAPVGALAECVADGSLRLHAAVFAPDGSRALRGEGSAAPEEADALGVRVAEGLLRAGAAELMERAAVSGGMRAIGDPA
jgi:hydroxymethylbilane synthase